MKQNILNKLRNNAALRASCTVHRAPCTYRCILALLFLFVFSTSAFSQKQVRKEIRSGNKAYKKENYTDAEVDYRKALEKNIRSSEAAYDLGNSLYRQGKAKDAVQQFQMVIANETDKKKLAMAWHNTGNVFLASYDSAKVAGKAEQVLKTSIEAYKHSLRNNPHDDETRYNLALAQKLLKDQQQNPDQNQDKNQDQDKKQDKQDQKQDQQQKQDQNQKQDQKQDQQKQDQMSQENADQILDAMMQEEKDTQEKVKAQQVKQQQRRKNDKNW